jgi:DNA-binding CsgD family transcriptional regulator
MRPKGLRDRSADRASGRTSGAPGDGDFAPVHMVELRLAPEIMDQSAVVQGGVLHGDAASVDYVVLPGGADSHHRYSVTLVACGGIPQATTVPRRIRVLIANREPLVLRGLESVLSQEPDISVVLTTMPTHLVAQCIRTVQAGDEFLEKEILIKTLTGLMRRTPAAGPRGGALTEREREVAELVAAGLSNSEIARRLSCGAGTVKSHVHSIYDKLSVHSRYALMMRFAGDRGES